MARYNPNLPDKAYVLHPVDGTTILVTQGVLGYTPTFKKVNPQKLNTWLNGKPLSKKQEDAMLDGSMFGWDCPAANI